MPTHWNFGNSVTCTLFFMVVFIHWYCLHIECWQRIVSDSLYGDLIPEVVGRNSWTACFCVIFFSKTKVTNVLVKKHVWEHSLLIHLSHLSKENRTGIHSKVCKCEQAFRNTATVWFLGPVQTLNFTWTNFNFRDWAHVKIAV